MPTHFMSYSVMPMSFALGMRYAYEVHGMAVCLGRAGTSAAELRKRLVRPDGLRFGELHDKVVVLRVPKH